MSPGGEEPQHNGKLGRDAVFGEQWMEMGCPCWRCGAKQSLGCSGVWDVHSRSARISSQDPLLCAATYHCQAHPTFPPQLPLISCISWAPWEKE